MPRRVDQSRCARLSTEHLPDCPREDRATPPRRSCGEESVAQGLHARRFPALPMENSNATLSDESHPSAGKRRDCRLPGSGDVV